MAKFKVGEIAVLRDCIELSERNNTECLVLEYDGDTFIGMHEGLKGERYKVRFSDGLIISIMGYRLYKKKPPQETSSWEEIQKISGWNPAKISEGIK